MTDTLVAADLSPQKEVVSITQAVAEANEAIVADLLRNDGWGTLNRDAYFLPSSDSSLPLKPLEHWGQTGEIGFKPRAETAAAKSAAVVALGEAGRTVIQGLGLSEPNFREIAMVGVVGTEEPLHFSARRGEIGQVNELTVKIRDGDTDAVVLRQDKDDVVKMEVVYAQENGNLTAKGAGLELTLEDSVLTQKRKIGIGLDPATGRINSLRVEEMRKAKDWVEQLARYADAPGLVESGGRFIELKFNDTDPKMAAAVRFIREHFGEKMADSLNEGIDINATAGEITGPNGLSRVDTLTIIPKLVRKAK
jgi:hypothetical protein